MHEQHTEKARGLERYRRVLLSGLAQGAATFISLIVGLVSLPLTVHYLGPERYGLWVALGSWLSLAAFSDLGVGNAIVTMVAREHGREDEGAARRHIATGVVLLTGVGAVLVVLVLALAPLIDWGRVLNVHSTAAIAEVAPTLEVLAVGFACTLPLSAIMRVYPAYQEGYVGSVWDSIGATGSLVGIVVVSRWRLGLPYLAGVVLLFRVGAMILGSAYLLLRRRPGVRPRIGDASRQSARELLSTGGLYVIANIGFLLQLQAPYLIGPHAVGLPELGRFGVAQRLFSFAATLPLMFLAPLWPAYGEALARGDATWARTTLRRSYGIGIGFALLAGLALVLSGRWVLGVWIGRGYTVSVTLLAILALWLLSRSWQEIHSMFLNGAGQIRGMAAYGTAAAILSLFLCHLLGQRWGAEGLALGWILGFAGVSGWLLPLDVRAALRQTAHKPATAALGREPGWV